MTFNLELMYQIKGIKASSGRFIAGLDDDDEFMPNRIELLVKNYDEQYAFITSNNIIIQNGSLYITTYKSIVNLEDMLFDNAIDNQGLISEIPFTRSRAI